MSWWTTYLSSHHQLHHEEEVFVVLVDVEELHDVGVVHLLQNVDFILKTDLIFFSELAPKRTEIETSVSSQMTFPYK